MGRLEKLPEWGLEGTFLDMIEEEKEANTTTGEDDKTGERNGSGVEEGGEETNRLTIWIPTVRNLSMVADVDWKKEQESDPELKKLAEWLMSGMGPTQEQLQRGGSELKALWMNKELFN